MTLNKGQFFGKVSENKEYNDIIATNISEFLNCLVLSYEDFKTNYITFNKDYFENLVHNRSLFISQNIKN